MNEEFIVTSREDFRCIRLHTAVRLPMCFCIGNEGAIAIAREIEKHSSLTDLVFCGNNIGDEGAMAIANALKDKTTLTRLGLTRNRFYRGNTLTDVGAIATAELLRGNNTLRELWLSENNIGNEGAVALANVLKMNSTLMTLSLGSNQIGEEGANAILRAVTPTRNMTKYNSILGTIFLQGNKDIPKKLEAKIYATIQANRRRHINGAFRLSRVYILVHAYVEYRASPLATSFWYHACGRNNE
jgi:Ran GTPase-activating protein (RanGAP) involved in mRNA processing and transport